MRLFRMLEKEIESQILQYLNLQPGVFAFKINTVGIYDVKRKVYRTNRNPFVHRGTSDILCCVRGIFLAIEVKTPKTIKAALKNTVSDQWAFINKVKASGGTAIMVSSLKEVEELLEIF